MLIQTGKMANSSYAHFQMPMKEVGADVDPVDAIGGGTYTTSATSAGDGTKITFGTNASATLSGGSLPDADLNSFIIMLTADEIESMIFLYGEAANSSISMSESFGTETGVIKFGLTQAAYNLTGEDWGTLTDLAALAFVVDRENATFKILKDGVAVADTVDISDSADIPFNHAVSNLRLNNFHGYGLDVFIFDESLPSDWETAIADMGAKRKRGDMRIYGPWEAK